MGRKQSEDVLWDGRSVNLWHAWRDKPGMPYYPVLWDNGRILNVYGNMCYCVNSLDELIHTIAHYKLFVLCRDVLSESDIPYSNELLGARRVKTYLSRSGSVAALRISEKKSSGFLVPGRTWGFAGQPTTDDLKVLIDIFLLFGFMATTPSSLAEKVLRSRLPDNLYISRPSIALRADILDNHRGGRIDQARVGRFYHEAYEYDKIKAYLFHSIYVPDPRFAPVLRSFPTLDDVLSYPTGYWLCTLVCRSRSISPLNLNGEYPEEGEVVTIWLWTFELKSCIESGYVVKKIHRGYGFRAMSSFMEEWSTLLWEKFEQAESQAMRDIIKSMMVGLPGRFLRRPETYTLIPLSDARKRTPGKDDGDIPLRLHWEKEGDHVFSDYAIRPEYDQESTALSQVGSYIVASMRTELYQRMLAEHVVGNEVIRSYIDCFTVTKPTYYPDILGTDLGQWKEVHFEGPFYAEANRFVGISDGKKRVVAPGMEKDSAARNEFSECVEIGF